MVFKTAICRTSVDRFTQIRNRLLRCLNMKVLMEDNAAVVQFPGFKYDDFDRAGNVNFVRVIQMADVMWFKGHPVLDSVGSSNLVVHGCHWQFTPELYSRAATELPTTLKSWVSRCGKTFVDMCQSIRESTSGDLLAQGVYRLVNVEPKTQSTSLLPEELREMLLEQDITEPGVRFPLIKPPVAVPDGSFSREIVVRYDDMNFLFHSTHCAYLSFARECAAHASNTGFYSRLTDDIAFHRAIQTTGIHFAESFAGDALKINTWEDPSCPLLLHFTVSKDNHIIYYTTVQYMDDSQSE